MQGRLRAAGMNGTHSWYGIVRSESFPAAVDRGSPPHIDETNTVAIIHGTAHGQRWNSFPV